MLNERMDMEDALRKEHENGIEEIGKELNMKHQMKLMN